MFIDLSPAQLGVIVSSIQSCYSSQSIENDLAIELCNKVYAQLGDELYDDWVDEFGIV